MGFTVAATLKDLGLPGVWCDAIEIDYSDPTWTPQVPVRAFTHVFGHLSSVNITTAFTAGSTATIAVGDSAAANNYAQTGDITVTSTGITLISGTTRTNAKGKYYASADNVKFAFTTNSATDTAGVAYGLVAGFYFGNATSGAMISAIR